MERAGSRKKMKPLIGITLDWQKDGSFSKRPHYALRTHYFDAVAAAGGLGFGIPYQEGMIAGYVARKTKPIS